MIALNIFTIIFCGAGVFFFFAGSIGLLRFPNVLSRLHALTKADNLGLGMIVVGLLPQMSSIPDALQLILVWVLVMVSGASCGYLIASQVEKSEQTSTREEIL
jgi:multicomponent Na+:H+ antiporter subunit G